MAARLVKIINVRVDAAVAAAIERRIACEGGNLSDFARHALTTAAIRQGQKVRVDSGERRERAALLAELARVTADLRRLGNLQAYSLKAGRPISLEEERTRIDALAAVRDAARRLVGP